MPEQIDACVTKVKTSLRSDHKGWSEEKVTSVAFAICNKLNSGGKLGLNDPSFADSIKIDALLSDFGAIEAEKPQATVVALTSLPVKIDDNNTFVPVPEVIKRMVDAGRLEGLPVYMGHDGGDLMFAGYLSNSRVEDNQAKALLNFKIDDPIQKAIVAHVKTKMDKGEKVDVSLRFTDTSIKVNTGDGKNYIYPDEIFPKHLAIVDVGLSEGSEIIAKNFGKEETIVSGPEKDDTLNSSPDNVSNSNKTIDKGVEMANDNKETPQAPVIETIPKVEFVNVSEKLVNVEKDNTALQTRLTDVEKELNELKTKIETEKRDTLIGGILADEISFGTVLEADKQKRVDELKSFGLDKLMGIADTIRKAMTVKTQKKDFGKGKITDFGVKENPLNYSWKKAKKVN